MKYLKSMALAAGFIAFGAIAAQAEGVDEINPDVAKRLYNPDMLDPSQPVDASPLRDFKAKNPDTPRIIVLT